MSIDLNDPDVKAAIKAAVDEATTGLIAKRDELLNENKQLKKGRTVDPEQVTKLEDQIDTLRDELSAAQKAAKTATTDAEKARKALESESGYVQKAPDRQRHDRRTDASRCEGGGSLEGREGHALRPGADSRRW
jgi:septal ring factor EnvC (AmiA/AmiB activator)